MSGRAGAPRSPAANPRPEGSEVTEPDIRHIILMVPPDAPRARYAMLRTVNGNSSFCETAPAMPPSEGRRHKAHWHEAHARIRTNTDVYPTQNYSRTHQQ